MKLVFERPVNDSIIFQKQLLVFPCGTNKKAARKAALKGFSNMFRGNLKAENLLANSVPLINFLLKTFILIPFFAFDQQN